MMATLGNHSITLQDSLEIFWNTFGRDYLVQSHEYTMMNIGLGCTPIRMESFKANFTVTIDLILQTYGLKQEVIPLLIERLRSADESTRSEAERRADAHITDNKYSLGFLKEVKDKLMNTGGVREMVETQRRDLNY